jgi:hypothetical protein
MFIVHVVDCVGRWKERKARMVVVDDVRISA